MNYLLNFLIYTISNVFESRIEDDPVDEPELDTEMEAEPQEDEESEEAVAEKEGLGDDEDYEEPKISRRQAEIIKLRHERREAEKRYDEARKELEAARRQPVAQPVNTHEETLRKQEDAVLNNPESTDWQRYSVQSARDAREAKQAGQVALREARDINDKASFSQKFATTQPKTYGFYAPKVEERLREIRARGQDATREDVYAFLMGKDMAEGKLKTSAKAEGKIGGVNRGSTPKARSDVSTKESSRMSDAERREKRLENVRI